MTEYPPEVANQKETAMPCDVVRDPQVYREAKAPSRQDYRTPTTREKHIMTHSRDFEKAGGWYDFDHALPHLADIAASSTSTRFVDRRTGNTCHYSPEERMIVVTRDKPNNTDIEEYKTPPEPPIIITAYRVSGPSQFKAMMRNNAA